MTKTKSQKARRRQAVAKARGLNVRSVRQSPRKKVMLQGPISYQKSASQRPNVLARKVPATLSYLRSLQYPEASMGTKCPDPSTFVPTGTMQLMHRFTINSVSDGSTPPVYYAGVFLHPRNQALYSMISSATKGGGGTYTQFGFANTSVSGWTPFSNNYDRYRVVSGCVSYEFTGSSFYNQGQTCVWADYDGSSPNTWESAVADSSSILVPARESVKVCYRPQDNSDYEFVPTSSTYENQHFGFFCKGVDATFSAVVTVVLNVEGIPNVESSSIVNPTQPNNSVLQLNQAKAYLGSILLFGGVVKGGNMMARSVINQMNDLYTSG